MSRLGSLRRFGATFEGELDEAYLGLDKEKFHRAARWEAGKTLVMCIVVSAIVLAVVGLPAWPYCALATVLLPVATYYWTRYMVLQWRHDRLRAFCRKRAAASEDEVVTLNEASFVKFLQQSSLGRKVIAAYDGLSPEDIFDKIDDDGDEQITAKQIHRRMSAEGKQGLSRADLRRELTQSDFATSGCMRKKAVEEQQLRQQAAAQSGGQSQSSASTDVLTGALIGLDILGALGLGDD